MSEAVDLPIIIAPATDSHRPFILKTWLTRYGEDSDFVRFPAQPNSLERRWRIQKNLYFERHQAIASAILERAQVRIATTDGDLILGFSVIEPETEHGAVVHFVHVRQSARGNRLGTRLVEGLPQSFRYTHQTSVAANIAQRWRIANQQTPGSKPEALYDPYLL